MNAIIICDCDFGCFFREFFMRDNVGTKKVEQLLSNLILLLVLSFQQQVQHDAVTISVAIFSAIFLFGMLSFLCLDTAIKCSCFLVILFSRLYIV